MSGRWSHIRGVLFDKDGTLLDYAKTWIPINHEVALVAANGDRALADTLLLAGGHNPKTDHITPGSPLAAAGADGIARCFAHVLGARTPRNLEATISGIFAEGGGRTAVLIDGVREAVATLKAQGIVAGLATNDSVGGMRASLARVGMLHDFAFLIAADSGHGPKPGPGMALAFAEAVGLAPGTLAAVGDASHDLEMAKHAGYGLKIAVLSGTGTRADLAAHADVVINSVCDLPALLAAAG
jgi:phosphoglycolate phosphatase